MRGEGQKCDLIIVSTVPRIMEGNNMSDQEIVRAAIHPAIGIARIGNSKGRYQTLAGSGWILVGDAGMIFDPLSGWGTTKAMVSAAAAVGMILNGSNYQAASDELWQSYLRQYRDYYLAELRWSNSPFWCRRHQVIQKNLFLTTNNKVM